MNFGLLIERNKDRKERMLRKLFLSKRKNTQIALKSPKEKKYLRDQVEEMERHKWIESEKAGRDLGDQALLDWVSKHASRFRETWENIHGKTSEDTNGMCCSGCKR